MVSFPYYSHTTPIRIPKDMGMVWEAYHKGVPLLGVPEISLESTLQDRLPRLISNDLNFQSSSLRHFVAGEGGSQQVPENGGLLSHQGHFTLAFGKWYVCVCVTDTK